MDDGLQQIRPAEAGEPMNITPGLAARVLSIIDQGLVNGVGEPEPGKLCVEAAVCLALGEPHGDEPSCVAPEDRTFKIKLNDSDWSSPAARASGLRRIGVMQLGTQGTDRKPWAALLAELTIRRVVPEAMEAVARLIPDRAVALRSVGQRCRDEGTPMAAVSAADAAGAARNAAVAAAGAASVAARAAAGAARAAGAAADAAGAAADAAGAAADAAGAAGAAGAARNAAGAARAAWAAAGADRVLIIAARCAEEAYERTGSPGVEALRKLEGKP